MRTIKRTILLNPGPATTTDSVKLSQVVPDICPRESEFGQLMEYVSIELTRLVADPDHYTTVLFGGSGTAAVESIISSVLDDDVVVIINNGAYGKRMCEMAEAYGLHYLEFISPPDDAIDLGALERYIKNSDRTISHLAVVHHETTTGLLNDIKEIGELCKRHRIDMIVDAMSSFAAIPIQMKEMNISYLASSSNKNLQGMAGVAFVIAEKSKLECMKHKKPRNYYLNLYDQYKYFLENRQMRFTPPVQTLYALKQAIEELKQEGVKERYKRYVKSWETLIKGITRLGLTYIVPEAYHSKIVTSIVEPDCTGYDFQEMHDYFYSRGITIYPGKLDGLKTFRIANIGDITYKDIETFLELLERYLRSIDDQWRKVES
ncbi:2-aminoethylphosphonate aminotransferase [Thermoflavimicrobium dichotomicum]|uniref:2-aminoethylphosphonate--pyruvate transaminase n=1 Tax=Thermoflavimicrobium dichotomicum TaxID=46223 RepID=A0A1I3UX36_9BACL|nr:2-aminoethylphosphonate--pyruvate transaminase [Thermoflavimicrobium dichotomicum]SFJ87480.1 2-aminoethylphosphonate-pyruvate transaminase [Thermoflavimicrobium dichotomicum]